MHVCKLALGLEKLKFDKITSLFSNNWFMVSVRPSSYEHFIKAKSQEIALLINSLGKILHISPYCVTTREKSILTCRVMFFSVADWPIVIFLKNLSFVSITEIRKIWIYKALREERGRMKIKCKKEKKELHLPKGTHSSSSGAIDKLKALQNGFSFHFFFFFF